MQPLRTIRRRFRLLRARVSLVSLLAEHDPARVVMIATAVNGAVALAVITAAAWITHRPMLFASLAPSAFILFSKPFSGAATPRALILGHGAGVACGWSCWRLVSAVLGEPVSIERFGAGVAISVLLAFAATSLLLVRLRSDHAPACATALIVAMGTVTALADLLVMMAAVVLLAVSAVTLMRFGGVRVPIWGGGPEALRLSHPGPVDGPARRAA